jgi:hypothetical protein|tara:strand:+ start:1 stop:1056 length:1056 start_codon:yes stop_codon:yes gene_type:complete
MQFAELDSVSIFELDTNDDVMMVWNYPSVDDELREVLLSRSELREGATDAQATPFRIGKHGAVWHYMHTPSAEVALPNAVLPKTAAVTLCITSSRFNPEKYEKLLELLAHEYVTTGEPIGVMKAVLLVATTQKCSTSDKALTWRADSFDDQSALLAGCSLAEVIRHFGQESILLWHAMLLKKRIVVLGSNAAHVQRLVRALPLLVWHRRDWSILRPLVQLEPSQLADLDSAGVYCAGFTDDSVTGREAMRDVLVDMDSRHVIVSSGARDDFKMTTHHKSLAKKLMEAGAANGSNEDLVKVALAKTTEIIKGLKKLAAGSPLTPEVLQAKGLSADDVRFFFNVASVEGFADL